MSVALAFTAAALFGIGTYLVLQHTLTRILIGLSLITHGVNVLLMGSAIAMRYASGGIDEVRAISRVQPWTILGGGLLLAAVTAGLPLLFGDEVLEAAKLELDLPVVGAVKLSSTLAFDLGVFFLVVGLVLMVFEAFGDDPSLDQGEGSRA